MRTEIISSEPGLVAIRDEWAALWTRCPYATPFQTPEWLIPWRQLLGQGELWVVTARSGDYLTGLFPFCISGSPRRLSLMGEGISDYLDVLVDPGRNRETMTAVLERLWNDRDEWDIGEFYDMRDESPFLSAVVPQGFFPGVAPSSVCPVCALPATAEAFYAGLSKRQRRHVRSALKQAESSFRVEFTEAGEHTLDAALGDLFTLHASRWNERALPGVLSEERIHEFHRRAAAGLLRRGMLHLYTLAFDGVTVASIYAIRAYNRMYSYIGGFDPAFGDFSPGMIAIGLAINDSIRSKIREFDFLRGGEPYKYAWGAENRWTRRLTLRHPVVRPRAPSREARV